MNNIKLITLFIGFLWAFSVHAQKQKPDRSAHITEDRKFFLELYRNYIPESAHRYDQFVKHKLSNGKTELVCAITDTSTILKGRIYEGSCSYNLGDTLIPIIIRRGEILSMAIFEKKEGSWRLKQISPIVKIMELSYWFRIKFLKENIVLVDFADAWERPDEVVILHPNNTVERYLKSPRRDLEFMFPSKH
jgi:hypothetical protein